MIQIPAQASVFVMHEPVSFRKGIDGMAGVARVVLAQEPMSGALFVFRNRRRQMLRILFYDGGGFWLCTRRLSKGTFSYWPESDGTGPCSPLLARELQVLIWGGDPASCVFPEIDGRRSVAGRFRRRCTADAESPRKRETADPRTSALPLKPAGRPWIRLTMLFPCPLRAHVM